MLYPKQDDYTPLEVPICAKDEDEEQEEEEDQGQEDSSKNLEEGDEDDVEFAALQKRDAEELLASQAIAQPRRRNKRVKISLFPAKAKLLRLTKSPLKVLKGQSNAGKNKKRIVRAISTD